MVEQTPPVVVRGWLYGMPTVADGERIGDDLQWRLGVQKRSGGADAGNGKHSAGVPCGHDSS